MRIASGTLAALALAAALAACGSSKDPTVRPDVAQASVPDLPRDTRPADPAAARVVRAWTDAQRASNIERASSYFSLPSIVQNGAQPHRLRSRADARAFNSSLPCGAHVLKVYAFERFTVASFRLTNRPGARCDGVGHQAGTAFLIRGGKIAAWLRIADRPTRSGEGGSQAPAPEVAV